MYSEEFKNNHRLLQAEYRKEMKKFQRGKRGEPRRPPDRSEKPLVCISALCTFRLDFIRTTLDLESAPSGESQVNGATICFAHRVNRG